MFKIEKKKIVGTNISICSYQSVVRAVLSALNNSEKLLIFPLATHTLIESLFDPLLKRVLEQYDILTPDSWWIMKSINWIYYKNLKERVYGPSLMRHILKALDGTDIPIFLYGTNQSTLNTLTIQIKKKYKNIIIGGVSPAPYGEIVKREIDRVVSEINTSKACVVFISLSSPKQVMVAYSLAQKHKRNCIYIPVGAAFDFIGTVKKQAPLWMQDSGLEWLFRLSQEPKRLFWRYLKTGTLYLILIMWQKLTQKK